MVERLHLVEAERSEAKSVNIHRGYENEMGVCVRARARTYKTNALKDVIKVVQSNSI